MSRQQYDLYNILSLTLEIGNNVPEKPVSPLRWQKSDRPAFLIILSHSAVRFIFIMKLSQENAAFLLRF